MNGITPYRGVRVDGREIASGFCRVRILRWAATAKKGGWSPGAVLTKDIGSRSVTATLAGLGRCGSPATITKRLVRFPRESRARQVPNLGALLRAERQSNLK